MLSAVIIGGGFFGAMAARQLAARHGRGTVALLETGDRLMGRASRFNQARVHHGYHYPRSLTTAAGSQRHYRQFAETFPDAVDESFTALYAIARRFSLVTPASFSAVMNRIGAPLEPASAELTALFDPEQVEAVFRVTEAAFRADRVRDRLTAELSSGGVDVRLSTRAERVAESSGAGGPGLVVTARSPTGEISLSAERVLLCTYDRLNEVLSRSGLPVIPLRHERTELCRVRLPARLSRLAITVMCGPFWSAVPWPEQPGCHTLSHVRYTPQRSWSDSPETGLGDPAGVEPVSGPSAFRLMVRDAARFVPAVASAVAEESHWAVKTILPRNDIDDGRPILHRRDHGGLRGLDCVLGAKLDNVFDWLEAI